MKYNTIVQLSLILTFQLHAFASAIFKHIRDGGDRPNSRILHRANKTFATFESWARSTEFVETNSRCGSDDPTSEEIKANDELVQGWIDDHSCNDQQRSWMNPLCSDVDGVRDIQKTSAQIIRMHFHVIQEDNEVGKLTEDNIYDALEVLNHAYHPEFHFILEDVNWLINADWYQGNNELSMKSNLKKGGCTDLNIYTLSPVSGYLGKSTFPWKCENDPIADGVIIENGCFPGGSAYPYNRGNTLVHEIGHWLGLYHTFSGGCTLGDRISDTAPERSMAYGCPIGRDTCPGGGPDPIHNYMDYSDDSCMDHFTPGQHVRMRAAWERYREPFSTGTNNDSVPQTASPTMTPTQSPTLRKTDSPTAKPSQSPTKPKTDSPTATPSQSPTLRKTESPTATPSQSPTLRKTESPTATPFQSPTDISCGFDETKFEFVAFTNNTKGYVNWAIQNRCTREVPLKGRNSGNTLNIKKCISSVGYNLVMKAMNDKFEYYVKYDSQMVSSGILEPEQRKRANFGSCNTPTNNLASSEAVSDGNWDNLFIDSFEKPKEWGHFVSKGRGVGRWWYVGKSVHSGSASLYIRDGENRASSIFTDPINISSFKMIRVQFWYYAWSLEKDDGFLLEYSIDGAKSWVKVRHWKVSTDFINDNWKKVQEYIAIVDEVDSIIARMRCHSSSNNDKIFIDDVEVSGKITQESGNWERIFFNDFEAPNDMGNFRFGGRDARRHETKYTHSGDASLYIRGRNSNGSYIQSKTINVSNYFQIRVRFWFFSWNMRKDGSFWLEYSTDGGNSWIKKKTWKTETDFFNYKWYEEIQDILFKDTVGSIKFRFGCTDKTKKSKLFIDDIGVSGKKILS